MEDLSGSALVHKVRNSVTRDEFDGCVKRIKKNGIMTNVKMEEMALEYTLEGEV